MMSFPFKETPISNKAFNLKVKVNAKVVSRVLNKLKRITPEAIVSEASKKSSPLHRYFEWDDTKAAHAYRLSQARNLVLSIGIETDGNFMRSYTSVVVNSERFYLPTEVVSKSPQLVDQVLQSIFSELLFWKAKHQRYEKFFSGIFGEIDIAEAKLKERYGKKEAGKREGRSRHKDKYPTNKKASRDDNNYRRLTASR